MHLPSANCEMEHFILKEFGPLRVTRVTRRLTWQREGETFDNLQLASCL